MFLHQKSMILNKAIMNITEYFLTIILYKYVEVECRFLTFYVAFKILYYVKDYIYNNY